MIEMMGTAHNNVLVISVVLEGTWNLVNRGSVRRNKLFTREGIIKFVGFVRVTGVGDSISLLFSI